MDKTNFLIFDFNGYLIRVVILGDEPWFVVRDVCSVLDIEDDAINAINLKDDVALTDIIDSIGKKSAVQVVNNTGLYELIFRNAQPNNPKHVDFKKWISNTILPFLYKTGKFAEQDTNDSTKRPEWAIHLKRGSFHFYPIRSFTCGDMQFSIGRIGQAISANKKEVI